MDVNATDSLILHVTNSLDQATSIHHHGMFFNSTTWMDGTDGVTEWYLNFLTLLNLFYSDMFDLVEFLQVVNSTMWFL